MKGLRMNVRSREVSVLQVSVSIGFTVLSEKDGLIISHLLVVFAKNVKLCIRAMILQIMQAWSNKYLW